jgi:hypothetical protein
MDRMLALVAVFADRTNNDLLKEHSVQSLIADPVDLVVASHYRERAHW